VKKPTHKSLFFWNELPLFYFKPAWAALEIQLPAIWRQAFQQNTLALALASSRIPTAQPNAWANKPQFRQGKMTGFDSRIKR
jgi:hypothetical protein